MSVKISRRDLLKGAAVGGFSFMFLRDSRMAFGSEANSKLNIGIIGCGGKGRGNLDACAGENIIALCDVDANRITEVAERFPNAKHFSDYRVMLDKMGSKLDAVVVSTPDHNHAPASVMAMKMGKHIYCEKPLTRTIHEARMMRDLAKANNLATQMGNQGVSGGAFREALEVLRSGAIGQVYEIHAWSDRPIWPQGINRPKETPEVPKELDWNAWLGPAPVRPYNPAYHPFAWRGWVDFGTGALGDMGCHLMSMAFMAFDLRNPISVVAEAHEATSETFPKSSIVSYSFPARGELRACKLKWYDGGLKPSKDLLDGRDLPGNGMIFVGEKGIFYSPDAYGNGYELLPKDRFVDFKKPEPTIPRSPGHHAEWIIACKGGAPTFSNFDTAAGLTETVLLGNLAILTGETIYWDAKEMRAINCSKAGCYVQTDYRKGWKL